MTYIFRYRYIHNYNGQIPLKPGKYTFTNDYYEVDREPFIGESCTDYIIYVKQNSKLIKSVKETVKIEE